ncbi:G2 mitotic-specific cyclin [Brachionus plicatilis]|uniref:G2 mitotic-specific cyclin n=1 Tax=Brachionus plicatilis TaxID=10195 RepID=A0A3M7S4N3_BRAPC|nr:G2 mitotic-specific cyclin [Brachionus plicatilis]
MVARNMAVSVYVTNKKDIFEINYPSEPVIAEASAYLMNSIGHHRMVDILIDCLESSLISKGEKGETISKLILLFAKDKAANKDQVQDPLKFLDITRVGEFLQTLYGKCEEKRGSVENDWLCSGKKKHCCIKMINEQIKNASILLNGFINFNHFVPPKYFMSNTLLVPALKRRAAYQCKQNEKSIDFINPVCINKENLDLIRALIVQVKLYHDPSKPRHKSYVEYAFKEMSKDFTGQKGFLAIISSQGISQNIFPILNSGLDVKLVSFSQANEKIFKSNQDSDNIKLSHLGQFTNIQLNQQNCDNS